MHDPYRKSLAVLTAFILTGASVQASWAQEVGQAERITRARSVAHEMQHSFPGYSIAVSDGTTIVWQEGFGEADLEQHVPVTPETRFPVFSISKKWTVAGAARLMESGLLDPHAAVQTYVPSFPEKSAPITAWQLATHTSGIRHYKDDEEVYSSRSCSTVMEAVSIFADDPLVFEPGTTQGYSTWGYVLLSAVMEAAAKQDFLSYMTTQVFQPLDMSATVFGDPSEIIPSRADLYERSEDGSYRNLMGANPTCKWGGGAFLSTAGDVVRFITRLHGGDLVGGQLAMQILGPNDDGIVRAGGFSPGAQGAVWMEMNTGRSIAILANASNEDVDLFAMAESIMAAYWP